jgi:hypothetical protein
LSNGLDNIGKISNTNQVSYFGEKMYYTENFCTLEEVLESRGFETKFIRDLFHIMVKSKFFISKRDAEMFFRDKPDTDLEYWWEQIHEKLSDDSSRVQIVDLILRQFSRIGTSNLPWLYHYSPMIIMLLLNINNCQETHTIDQATQEKSLVLLKSLKLNPDQVRYLTNKTAFPIADIFS